MRLFTHTIWIAKPPEAVFDFFVDLDQAPRWRHFVRTMTRSGTGPLTVGSTVHVTMEVAGSDYVFDLHVLACDRPTLWRHRTDEIDYDGFVEYRFAPDGDGTRVTLSVGARPNAIYGWLGLPLVLLRRGRNYRGQLPALKRVLESPDSPSQMPA